MSRVTETKKKFKRSLMLQIAIFFLIAIIVTQTISFFLLKKVSDRGVQIEAEVLTEKTTELVENILYGYKGYRWIIKYWLDHIDELELEYDWSVKTDVKEAEYYRRYPDTWLNRLSEEKLEALPPEDQKLVAEIAFNRILLKMNSIDAAFEASFLYLVAVDSDYKHETYLVSASNGKIKRGTELGQAYTLGVRTETTPDQEKLFRNIKNVNNRSVTTLNYMDLYNYFDTVDDYDLVIGMSFAKSEMKEQVQSDTVRYITAFIMMQILLSGLCLFLLYLNAIRPLKSVKRNVSEYGDTKDSYKVRKQLSEIVSRNEIGDLADSFSDMVTEIDEYLDRIKDITAEKERIGAELDVAAQIQADMLPSVFPPFPDVKEIDVYATMDPAKEVGGDFYDFFMVDDDHVALVVADVSGKGVPASLFMAISKSLIKSRTLLGGGPSDILHDVNNQLCEGNEAALFVTVWLAIIDIHTGEGIASNAGHEHPVLKKAGCKYELIEYKHSMAVGMIEDVRFEEHPFKVEPGDRIFSYSDGVPEATNVSEELYGTDRMLAALNRETDAGLEQTLKNLKADMDEFVGTATQFDDITMLVFDFYS